MSLILLSSRHKPKFQDCTVDRTASTQACIAVTLWLPTTMGPLGKSAVKSPPQASSPRAEHQVYTCTCLHLYTCTCTCDSLPTYLLNAPLHEHHVFVCQGPQCAPHRDLIRNDVVSITALQAFNHTNSILSTHAQHSCHGRLRRVACCGG